MREHFTQQGKNIVKQWEVRSGYEALVIGRVLTYGMSPAKQSTAPNIPISHSPELKPTYDEVEFLDRTLTLGKLLLDPETTEQAEKHLSAIAKTGKVYRSIRPDVAQLFLTPPEVSSPLEEVLDARQLEKGPTKLDIEHIGALGVAVTVQAQAQETDQNALAV